MTEGEDKGYTVKDRRFLHQSEEEKARIREEEGAQKAAEMAGAEAAPATEVPLPEITFPSFLFSMGTSVFVALGDIPDPATGETKKNLPLAKQTIDLLGLLREKTRNNLSEEEERLFDHLLYDLRMRYIREVP